LVKYIKKNGIFFCHLRLLPQDCNISKTSIQLESTGVWTGDEIIRPSSNSLYAY